MADEEIGQATAIFLENQPDSDHPTSDTPGRGDTAIRAAYLELRRTARVNNLDMLGRDIEKNLQVDEKAFFCGGFSALMTIRLYMEQKAGDETTDGTRFFFLRTALTPFRMPDLNSSGMPVIYCTGMRKD